MHAPVAEIDRELLAQTLELAERGRPAARPNPVVGAVLAQPGGTVLASGFHERYGGAHAERACLAQLEGPIPADATLYVSLEPCAHHGKQPPCVQAILERGVRRVVYASPDSNPETAGRGPELLRSAGVHVERGPEEIERLALQQNAGFHSRCIRRRPYVTAKWAMTENGRFATGDPGRRWISSEPSRDFVQWLRAGSGAVLVGVGTVLADDPQLTVRGPLAERITRQPARIVVDRELRTPPTSKLARSVKSDAPVLIATVPGAPEERASQLRAAGVEVWHAASADTVIDDLLAELARRQVNDLLVEAGPTLLAALYDARALDALSVFVAPLVARADLPGLPVDHPLVDHALLAPGTPSGDDRHHVRVLRPAWEFVGQP